MLFASAVQKEDSPLRNGVGNTLIRMLGSEYNPLVWHAAACALGELGYEPAVESLVQLLHFGNGGVAEKYRNADGTFTVSLVDRIIGEIGGSERYKGFSDVFEVRDVRCAAVYSLGQIGGEKATKEIRKTMHEDPNFWVRESAIRAYAIARGAGAIDEFIEFLSTSKEKSTIAEVLGELGEKSDERVISALEYLQNDENSKVAEYARKALDKLKDKQA